MKTKLLKPAEALLVRILLSKKRLAWEIVQGWLKKNRCYLIPIDDYRPQK